jgi:hypothetical protein
MTGEYLVMSSLNGSERASSKIERQSWNHFGLHFLVRGQTAMGHSKTRSWASLGRHGRHLGVSQRTTVVNIGQPRLLETGSKHWA